MDKGKYLREITEYMRNYQEWVSLESMENWGLGEKYENLGWGQRQGSGIKGS